MQLESREIPQKLVFDVFGKVGMQTATTFRGILHEGGYAGPDAFGFGNIPRGLPSELPRNNPASRNALGDDLRPVWTADDIERFGESLYTDTRVRRGRVGPPNVNMGATLGYGFAPHKGGKLGFLGTFAYRNMFAKQRFGSRDKLIAAILELEKRSKDAGYKARLEQFPLPRLLDAHQVADRKAKAKASEGAPKKKAAKKAPEAKAPVKKAPAKKAPASKRPPAKKK